MGKTATIGMGSTGAVEVNFTITPAQLRGKFDEELMYCLKVATDGADYRKEFNSYVNKLHFLVGDDEDMNHEFLSESLEGVMKLSLMFNALRLGLNDCLEDHEKNLREAIMMRLTEGMAINMLMTIEQMYRVDLLRDSFSIESLTAPADDDAIKVPEVVYDITKMLKWFEESGELRELMKVATDTEEYRSLAEPMVEATLDAMKDVGLGFDSARLKEALWKSVNSTVMSDAITDAVQMMATDPEANDLFKALHKTITRERAKKSICFIEDRFGSAAFGKTIGEIAGVMVYARTFGDFIDLLFDF